MVRSGILHCSLWPVQTINFPGPGGGGGGGGGAGDFERKQNQQYSSPLCRVLTRAAIEQPDVIQEQKNIAARYIIVFNQNIQGSFFLVFKVYQ